MHKAGFVNIVGNPNVGKSTLMNLLVGERISIATFKSQTTRHRIMGIYEYGRYADCILGHSGSSEAKLQVTGIYVELLRVGIGGRGYIAVCDRCGGENG